MIQKCRAWHKKEKKMYEVRNIRWFANLSPIVELKGKLISYDRRQIIIMQSTERKDIDKVELFAGDIIKHKNGHLYAIESPDIVNLCWSLCPRKDTSTGGIKGQDMRLHMSKRIGNIHDNPELLKGNGE